MKSRVSILDAVQAATGLAVLIGLGLVVFELRQAEQLARAELQSEGFSQLMESRRSQLSENFAATKMKA